MLCSSLILQKGSTNEHFSPPHFSCQVNSKCLKFSRLFYSFRTFLTPPLSLPLPFSLSSPALTRRRSQRQPPAVQRQWSAPPPPPAHAYPPSNVVSAILRDLHKSISWLLSNTECES